MSHVEHPWGPKTKHPPWRAPPSPRTARLQGPSFASWQTGDVTSHRNRFGIGHGLAGDDLRQRRGELMRRRLAPLFAKVHVLIVDPSPVHHRSGRKKNR